MTNASRAGRSRATAHEPGAPLLLNRADAAAFCGPSVGVFDELVATRAVPVMARSDARWTRDELRRAITLLQEEARKRRLRQEGDKAPCRSTAETTPTTGSSTSRSRAAPRSAARSTASSVVLKPPPSSEPGGPQSSKGKTRLLILMPGESLDASE